MPKSGTSTISKYLECTGFETSHLTCGKGNGICGTCIYEKIAAGLSPLCGLNKFSAFTQVDVTNPNKNNNFTCHFPQIEYLDLLHAAYPNATWILNLRPVNNWMRSVNNWNSLRSRFTDCDFPSIGFPRGVGKEDDDFRAFYEGQTARVREFVAQHPTQKLVEVEIESDSAASTMNAAFNNGVDDGCWGHANVGKYNKKGGR